MSGAKSDPSLLVSLRGRACFCCAHILSYFVMYSQCSFALHNNSSKCICNINDVEVGQYCSKSSTLSSANDRWSPYLGGVKCALGLLPSPFDLILKQRGKESKEFKLLKILDGNKKPAMSEISGTHHWAESVQKWFESHTATLLGIFMILDLSGCHRWTAINQQGSVPHSSL